MSIAQRINILSELGFISSAEKELLIKESQILSPNNADKMSENVIGVFGLPMSIATNFLINDKEYIVPMVVEEPSIVAGVSGAAKIIKRSGGFEAKMTESLLIGQIQVLSLNDINEAVSILEKNKNNLLKKANEILPNLIKRGGGVKELEIHPITLKKESTIVLNLLLDTKDAMGANLVNTLCENLANYLENLIGGKVGLRILSNLSDR
ncbi:MAG: hydroxymethylglutaryl-CoA reductase, partial [Pseudomonadota bacterium]|nr:hydroxymethylglutaryl-CoA reductase [Pseudomonadota bacterium]